MDKKELLNDTYKTIKTAKADVLFKDKGSKFIGYAYPIQTEEEVKPLLEAIKKQHHSARHWCYAWQLGVENVRYRVNDDGEPNNTAGQPIYGQILSKEITNVLIIVVRYFGGVKLGVGGLINAYKTTASLLLDACNVVTKRIKTHYHITFEYKDMNKVMRIIKENKLAIIKQEMNLNCIYLIEVRESEAEKVYQQFKILRCVTIKKEATE